MILLVVIAILFLHNFIYVLYIIRPPISWVDVAHGGAFDILKKRTVKVNPTCLSMKQMWLAY
jgi:hypothetical protein